MQTVGRFLICLALIWTMGKEMTMAQQNDGLVSNTKKTPLSGQAAAQAWQAAQPKKPKGDGTNPNPLTNDPLGTNPLTNNPLTGVAPVRVYGPPAPVKPPTWVRNFPNQLQGNPLQGNGNGGQSLVPYGPPAPVAAVTPPKWMRNFPNPLQGNPLTTNPLTGGVVNQYGGSGFVPYGPPAPVKKTQADYGTPAQADINYNTSPSYPNYTGPVGPAPYDSFNQLQPPVMSFTLPNGGGNGGGNAGGGSPFSSKYKGWGGGGKGYGGSGWSDWGDNGSGYSGSNYVPNWAWNLVNWNIGG